MTAAKNTKHAVSTAAPGARVVQLLPAVFVALQADVAATLLRYRLGEADATQTAQRLSQHVVSVAGEEWTVGATTGRWYRRGAAGWERCDPNSAVCAVPEPSMAAGVLPADPTIGDDPLGPPPALTVDGIGGESVHLGSTGAPSVPSLENLLSDTT